MKNEKKKNLCRNLEISYCPICIVRKETILQYSLLVLDCIAGCKAKLYCKTRLYCNRRGLEAGSSVLQYTALYCNLGARQGWTVLRYSAQPSHDTAIVEATRHAGAGRWACWVRRQGARGARWERQARHGRAERRRERERA